MDNKIRAAIFCRRLVVIPAGNPLVASSRTDLWAELKTRKRLIKDADALAYTGE